MTTQSLANTITTLNTPSKGILAADESLGTIGKRFAGIGVDNTEENRRAYRSLLCTTKGLNDYICGVILFEETLGQCDDQGTPLPKILQKNGIIPGIKVDKGLINVGQSNEKITQGLDGLAERVRGYREQGAGFAKWRNVYSIGNIPSYRAVRSGGEILARYAAICQNEGIVPIVEPEVLIDGDHTLEHCAKITAWVLHEVFSALYYHDVDLSHIVLKPSMVIAGKSCPTQASSQEIAKATLQIFQQHVPAAVPTINFLSGGQTPEQASANLNALNQQGRQPWHLSFSYGRALQEPCLATWQGKTSQKDAAQATLLKRARLNSAASLGEYTEAMEK